MKWVLTTLAFFIAAIVFASDFPKMSIIPVMEGKVLVDFESSASTSVEITITNQGGEILYYDRTKTRENDYRKIFNFSEFGEGTFCVSMNYGNRSINRDVQVSKKEIIVGSSKRLYEPYFNLVERKLNISFFNVAQKNVFVNIYKNGEHISGLNLGKEMTIQKCLNLSKLNTGEYTVVLTDVFKEHKFVVYI